MATLADARELKMIPDFKWTEIVIPTAKGPKLTPMSDIGRAEAAKLAEVMQSILEYHEERLAEGEALFRQGYREMPLTPDLYDWAFSEKFKVLTEHQGVMPGALSYQFESLLKFSEHFNKVTPGIRASLEYHMRHRDEPEPLPDIGREAMFSTWVTQGSVLSEEALSYARAFHKQIRWLIDTLKVTAKGSRGVARPPVTKVNLETEYSRSIDSDGVIKQMRALYERLAG